ncbi:hypothetical protein [Algoriphagus winogradskyi]|uniref:Uncharacterized protein n=1 Tax=Algoriphagus winogradskyi TaxID=237017 RepID=A0ABY1NBQ7_9BACT|nr:hypothetical protein [Algoriphagus winogradskyi]SMP05797.1 hypothetical protein SAMN06265367_101383 [Algoriphagus winogradskyi]
MNINPKNQSRIFEGGKESWESSAEFKKRIYQLKRQILEKYELDLSSEKNWYKRLIHKTRMWLEIWRKIREMKSGKNLHFAS